MSYPLNDLTAERDRRQEHVAQLCVKCFGPESLHYKERVTRLFEEVVELAQAEKLPHELLIKIIGYVYARPTGDFVQEAGGVGVCLLAYCASRKMSADICERNEIARVEHHLEQDPEHFMRRQAAKVASGVTTHEPSRARTVPRFDAPEH